MSTSSLYELLGVQADADAAAIKRARIAAARSSSPNLTRRADCAADSRQPQAYLKAARDTHPDKNGGDEAATERFQQVGRAYAVLSDAEKRKLYDETGMVDDGAPAAATPTPLSAVQQPLAATTAIARHTAATTTRIASATAPPPPPPPPHHRRHPPPPSRWPQAAAAAATPPTGARRSSG